MTFFAVHDESGRIVQGNKVYDPPADYEGRLRDMGQTFVKRETETILNPDLWWVMQGELHDRPLMPIEVSKSAIRAGSDEFSLLSGIPRGTADEPTTFTIFAGDVAYESGTLPSDASEIQYSAPVPCKARVLINKWPYQPFTANIEVY